MAVKKSHNGRTGSASKTWVVDFKLWLKGVENKESLREKGNTGFEGVDDSLHLLLNLAKHMQDTGEIQCQTPLNIVVLILKSDSG